MKLNNEINELAHPMKASPMPMECSFEKDTCQWRLVKNETKPEVEWALASVSRRPANLLDHTFAAPRNPLIIITIIFHLKLRN